MAVVRKEAYIRCQSNVCFDILARISNAPEIQETHTASLVKDGHARFRLWATTSGVFAEDQMSLDFRVREKEDFQSRFLYHLRAIECRLHNCKLGTLSTAGNMKVLTGVNTVHKKLVRVVADEVKIEGGPFSNIGKVNSSSPAPAVGKHDHFKDWSVRELLLSIQQNIGYLQRLSASTERIISKVESAKSFWSEDREFSERYLRDLCMSKVHEIGPEITDDWISNRLADTMVLRVEGILQRRSNQVEWDFSQPRSLLAENQQLELLSPATSSTSVVPTTNSNDFVMAKPTDEAEIARMNEYVNIAMLLYKPQLNKSSDKPCSVLSIDTKDVYQLQLPSRPRHDTQGETFTCPYCHLVLNRSMSEWAWRSHVKADLDPFICIFPNCNNSLVIYPTRESWISHMRKCHRMSWHCLINQTGSHQYTCDTIQEFENHMVTLHPDDFDPQELPLLKQISYQPVTPTIEACPFCRNVALDTEQHVIHHLQEFALSSLALSDTLLPSGLGEPNLTAIPAFEDDGIESQLPAQRRGGGLSKSKRPRVRSSLKPVTPKKQEPRSYKILCTECQTPFSDESTYQKHLRQHHTRPFTCIFNYAGCPSTFASKNEWKRHVSSQHLHLTYWLCTQDTCIRTENNYNLPHGAIFSRKDLYTQHVRRMHVPPNVRKAQKQKKHQPEWDEHLKGLQEEAKRTRYDLPRHMRCPAASCNIEFDGPQAWDERMDHIARHLERIADGKEPKITFGGDNDPTLTGWASRPEANIVRRAHTSEGWELVNPLTSNVPRRSEASNNAPSKSLLHEIVVAGCSVEDAKGEDEE